MSFSKKMREWYTSIEAFQFEGIAESITELVPETNPKYSQYFDSLLARLTHAYMKYNESNKHNAKIGLVIYKLTCCLCDRFSESSNPPRLRSGIYHIARCLREVGLFTESKKICNYVMPGKIFSSDAIDYEYFLKLSYSWRQSAEILIQSLSANFDSQSYETLLKVIKSDFELIKYSEKDTSYSKLLFTRLQKYIDKITNCGKCWTEKKIIKFCKEIVVHIKMMQNASILEIEPLVIYDDIVDIMHSLSCKMINVAKINELYDFLHASAKEFEIFLVKDVQVQKCFQLHLGFYKTLLTPVSSFDKNMLEELHNYRCQFRSRLKIFGPSKAMIANASGINTLINPICNYWLECMKSCEANSINTIFFEMVKLINETASLLAVQTIKTCKCNLKTCQAKVNTFEEINITLKCLSFVCMFDKKLISKDLLYFSQSFITEIIRSIREFKELKCGFYSYIWNTCGMVMYNLGLLGSLEFLDESAEMLSNLCSYIIEEDGIKCTNKFLKTSNPLSLALHKLSGVYYRAEKYREAMIVTAFNGLISYEEKEEESKAFKMWASIKHKCNSDEVNKQTMIDCLKADKAAIKELGVEINLNNYDLVKLCQQEIKGLQKAKVNLVPSIKASLKELDSLQSNTMEFVEGVQYLGYHALYFKADDNIMEYIKKAESYLSNFNERSERHSCLKANLEFFKFIDRCNTTNKNIKREMKRAKNILQRGKDETLIHDETIETDEVVPVYRMINMKHDEEVNLQLEKVLLQWKKCFAKNPREIINCWEPELTLDTIIIAGEIARLYLSQSCEKQAWRLAYKLSAILENRAACLYVTARSISLRYINDEWIEKAHIYAKSLKASEDLSDASAVGMFWTSLADFYFERGVKEEAVKLLNKVKDYGKITLTKDVPVYLEFLDTIIRNYKFYSENMNQEEYFDYIVHHVYSMISVNEMLNTGGKRVYYGLNNLLDSVNHVSHVMNSLISFREISSHLTLRLELAQSLGATLRVAECLKSLCFIDLSRLKLDDCEVKLQGIEQILDVEGFGLTMKSKFAESTTKIRMNTVLTSSHMDVDDPLRDVIQNEASPILRKKIFVPPVSLIHDNCDCYRCQNIPYQYLVFSSSHIRAQVYALKDYSSVALQHFQGAFDVRTKLLEKENSIILNESKNSVKCYPWQQYYTMIDFVLFLLDFSKFNMKYQVPREEEAMEIVVNAACICEKFNLETHPVYFAAKELFFQYRFQKLNLSFDAFTVPQVDDIDITDLITELPSKEKSKAKACFTPAHSGDLPIKVLHRKKTPPLLPLTKLSMNFSDSEDEDITTTKTTRRKPLRKKLVPVEEVSSSNETPTKPVSTKSKSSARVESVSLKKSAVSRTAKPLSDNTESLGEAFKEMSIQPKTSQFLISCENLLLKSYSLKLEHFQTTEKFEFCQEELNTLRGVFCDKELEEIVFSLDAIQVNFTETNVTGRTSRLKRKTSLNSKDNLQIFEKTRTKIIDALTSAIDKSKISKSSLLSNENILQKSKETKSSKMKLSSKSLDLSRPSSPDLFSSEDEANLKVSNTLKSKKLRDKVENCNKNVRVTRSRSTNNSSDTECSEIALKTSSKAPRKRS